MLQCRVNFLDDTYFVWELERNALGQDLFSKVCEHLDLLERDYYGLVMWDSPNTRYVFLFCFLVDGPVTEFFFNIKFYPPDPSIIAEDITRYLLCLQLRKDILTGRLPCPSDILALLGSYTVQSTIGDYDPNLHKNQYVSEIVLAPNQSEELEERIIELHSTYRFMSPAQADMLFLENAMGLPMYGVDLHPAKDVNDADVMLGVCSEGLIVYEDEIKTNIFDWPRVLKISHKRSTFLLKMRPSEVFIDNKKNFSLANYRACKQLWKCCVEHHSFFRNRLKDKKTKRILTLGSRFRYHGRTQSECLKASGNITRAPPRFTRFIIKREVNEEILDVLKQPIRTELDDWFLVYGPEKWHISTSDDVMQESKKLQKWKHHADDWCVLLDGSPFLPSDIQQPLKTEEQREDVKGTEERLTDELVITQTFEAQVIQEGSDIIEKELLDFELKQEIMKPLKETLKEEVLEVNGERIQRVVIAKQWTQEVNSSVESQEELDKKIESVEMLERRVMITEKKTLGSEGTFERLEIVEQRLEEVDAIERKLVEAEELRFGLQEVERFEQRLQQVEKEELQRAETVDWYILLDRMSLMPSATPPGIVQEDLQQIVYNPKPIKRYDDWYILFDVIPQTMEILRPLPGILVHLITQLSEILYSDWSIAPSSCQIYHIYHRPTKTGSAVTLKPDSLRGPNVELYEAKEEVIQSRMRTEEQVTEVMTMSTKEQIIVPEKMTSIIQTPEFPIVPRDNDDEWFQLFDKVPYEQKSFPSGTNVRSRDFEVLELIKDQRVQRVVEKQMREKTLITEEKRLIIDERRERADVDLPMIPVGVQEEDDDDWFEVLDTAPPEMRSVPSVSVATEERRMKEQEDRRMRQQQMRVREKEEEEERVREQEKRKQELEARRVQPAITVKTEAQPQIEKDDDWFILFDVSPNESVVADVLKVDRRAEEEKRRREEVEEIEERTKKTLVPEKKPEQLQTEVEDDCFILLGVSPKDYVPTLLPTPVISPVAPPKPRPQIPTDQPLTSTPTTQHVSIIKTYQEKTKDIWNITLESESEIESVLMRKIRRSEGENVYIRHSILMLEDFDVSYEMILKHYASITELKRDFMEVKQDFGPTEWDKRLLSYSPTAKAQFLHANEEILMRMGLIEDNGKTVLFRPQELIYI
uniref:Protein 4.1 n=1 Tax=Cyprinus carpio TaxID=7962 RepID=A0A8C2JEC5_CYPCA